MMLLSIVIAPLAVAALFIVMSWTERALDHEVEPPGSEPVAGQ